MPDPTAGEGGNILLTSGTTGHYKKILLDSDRRAIQAFFIRKLYEFSGQSVVNATNHRCGTTMGYQYPLITWAVGGTVVFREVNLFESLPRSGLTHAYGTPWTMAQVLSASRHQPHRDDAMRLFLTGGPLSQGVLDQIKARITRQVYTFVGAIEVSVFALTRIEQPEDLRWHRILPSREVQIVDAENRILPAGQEGLLRVRIIDGLQGYLHEADASRAFFRDGYFYTGDLGVIGPDGRLALIGRMTDVINVLGSKFAPGPIEEAVQREFGISGACVFSIRQADGEELVHIAIEARAPIDHDRLATLLGNMLPSPFQASVHLIEALPRNHMGKVQRDILKHQLSQVGKPSDIGQR